MCTYCSILLNVSPECPCNHALNANHDEKTHLSLIHIPKKMITFPRFAPPTKTNHDICITPKTHLMHFPFFNPSYFPFQKTRATNLKPSTTEEYHTRPPQHNHQPSSHAPRPQFANPKKPEKLRKHEFHRTPGSPSKKLRHFLPTKKRGDDLGKEKRKRKSKRKRKRRRRRALHNANSLSRITDLVRSAGVGGGEKWCAEAPNGMGYLRQ